MQYRSLLSSLSKFGGLGQSNHFGAVLALSSSLVLAACGGNGNSVTENNLTDNFGADGSAPTLTAETNHGQPRARWVNQTQTVW